MMELDVKLASQNKSDEDEQAVVEETLDAVLLTVRGGLRRMNDFDPEPQIKTLQQLKNAIEQRIDALRTRY